MPAKEISLGHAKTNKLFYFTANALVFRPEDGRVLILKRHEREKVHPGRFALPGGKLEWADFNLDHPTRRNGDVLDYEQVVEHLLFREVKEEAGIEIEPPFIYINSIGFVRPDGIPVATMKFAARYKSGEIVLEEDAFTDHAWVNALEVKKYDCLGGIPEEVAQTIAAFTKLLPINN